VAHETPPLNRDTAAVPPPSPRRSRPGDRDAHGRPHRARRTLAHQAVHTPGGRRPGSAHSLDRHCLDRSSGPSGNQHRRPSRLGVRYRKRVPAPAASGAHDRATTHTHQDPAPTPPHFTPGGPNDRATTHFAATLTAIAAPFNACGRPGSRRPPACHADAGSPQKRDRPANTSRPRCLQHRRLSYQPHANRFERRAVRR
jgi:hypothetical protein